MYSTTVHRTEFATVDLPVPRGTRNLTPHEPDAVVKEITDFYSRIPADLLIDGARVI